MADTSEQLTGPARIRRLTSAYDPREDRLLVSGETESGDVQSFLFTRSLLLKLLRHLLGILEGKHPRRQNQAPATLTDSLVQEVAQARAQARLQRQQPVVPAASASPWLVQTVDVTRLGGGARLVLGDGSGHRVETRLNGEELRQWLGILYRLWRQAGWGGDVWPRWIGDSGTSGKPDDEAVH